MCCGDQCNYRHSSDLPLPQRSVLRWLKRREPALGHEIWRCAPPRASGALLLAHYEHRAVGVPDNRLRNTAHQRPPYGAQTSATYHDRPCTYLLAQPHDLLIRLSRLEVSLGHLTPRGSDLLGLLLDERLGVPLGLFEHRLHDLFRVGVVSPELPGRGNHV